MIYHNDIFTVNSIEYQVALSELRGRTLATITPVLELEASIRTMVVAAIKVDGHELIPCFKLFIEDGRSRMTLKPVKIVNPLMNSDDKEKLYKITLEIYEAEPEPVCLDQHVGIKLPE